MKLRDNVELWDMVRHEVFSTAVRAVGDKGIRGSTAREVAGRILDAVDRALAAPSPGTGTAAVPAAKNCNCEGSGCDEESGFHCEAHCDLRACSHELPLAPPPTVTGGDFVAGVNEGPPTATPMTPAAEPGKPATLPHTWIKPAMAGGWTCTVKARGRLDVTCDRKAVVFCEDDHGNGTCLEGRCREHARRAR